MQRSSIEWTDFTANPIVYERKSDGKRVWACEKTSPGCKHCYAEALGKRYGKAAEFNAAEMAKLNVLVDEKQIRHILTATQIEKTPVEGGKVFIGDMTDIFGDWVPFALLDVVFAAFALRPKLTGQFLTKRPDRARAYLSDTATGTPGIDVCTRIAYAAETLGYDVTPRSVRERWPLPNVWIGTSCENQEQADARIPELLQTPASIRFISAEPLLGPLNISRWLKPTATAGRCVSIDGDWWHAPGSCDGCAPALDWVIPGGESGGGARQSRVDWIRSLVRQCRSAGRAVFVKQLGSVVIDRNDAGFLGETPTSWPDVIDQEDRIEHDLDGTRDGYQGAPVRIHLKSRKGGDPREWPRDLRVRQFPEAAA